LGERTGHAYPKNNKKNRVELLVRPEKRGTRKLRKGPFLVGGDEEGGRKVPSTLPLTFGTSVGKPKLEKKGR